ncbi:MAG: NAD-dependent epimerase/dehydratase family protein [Candidatus Acidiferrales bacterium]
MPMKIFIAGGTGVLGRATIPPLVEAGHAVRSTARGKEKAELVRQMGAEAVEIDLYDAKAIRQAIAGSDALIRLTTKIGSLTKMGSAKAWEETNRLRTTGAHILVDAAIEENLKVYVHESVTFVYPDGGTQWLTEEAPTEDKGSIIMRAALEGEWEAARFTQSGGRGIVLRFAGFYGTEAPSTGEMIKMARRELLFQIGEAANYFSSIYVPDAGRAVAAALSVAAGTYNVCDDNPVLFSEYLRRLAEAVGARKPRRLPRFLGKWVFGDLWKYLSLSQRISNVRLKQLSGWKPAVKSVAEGWPRVAGQLASMNL